MRCADAELRAGRLRPGDVLVTMPGDLIILEVAELGEPGRGVHYLSVRTRGGTLRRVRAVNCWVVFNANLVEPGRKV